MSADALQDRIDSYRRDLHRLREEIKSLDDELKSALPEQDRSSKLRHRAVLLDQLEAQNKEILRLSNQQQAKRHCSSFTVTVPGEQVSEVVLWKAEVVDRDVPREIVDVDELLVKSRELIADLRWLQLKLIAGRTSLDAVKIMRANRDRAAGKRDLEVPYHPLLLLFYEAAARGQIGLQFLAEDHALPKPREDIRGFINGTRKVPQECKSECVYNPGPDRRSSQSIDANAEALGKLLQVCRSACLDGGQPCRRLCSFAGRMEYIWFIEFNFTADGRLLRCRVAPFFPCRGQSIMENVLCPLVGIDSCGMLVDLLDPAPTAGFVLLSRYVDTLATLHSLPITPLELRTDDGQVLNMEQAQILAHGQHSLVLLPSPHSNFVVKISRNSLIDRERRIHSLVDGSSLYLRKMVAGTGGYGVVKGAGEGLAFILLDSVGTPFTATDASSDAALASLWDQASDALDAMHRKHILHRDVKPSNMILIHGSLLLNDFDVACELESEWEIAQVQVGTKEFHSPRLVDKWRIRDDWLSLALSFLSLRMPFPFADKRQALQQALQLTWVPVAMKRRIQDCYK